MTWGASPGFHWGGVVGDFRPSPFSFSEVGDEMTKTASIPGGQALVAQELKNRVEAQERKYRQTIQFATTLDVAGSAGAQDQQKLKLSTEGDFQVTHITCKLLGLSALGAVLDPATFGATGITLRLHETGWGRELFRGFVAAETIATPGYSDILYQAFPFDQILLAGSDVEFDLRNAAAVRQRLIFCFHGYQYRGSYKNLVS